jgi:hypothetical protein
LKSQKTYNRTLFELPHQVKGMFTFCEDSVQRVWSAGNSKNIFEYVFGSLFWLGSKHLHKPVTSHVLATIRTFGPFCMLHLSYG